MTGEQFAFAAVVGAGVVIVGKIIDKLSAGILALARRRKLSRIVRDGQLHTIVLEVDAKDFKTIRRGIAFRERLALLPKAPGNFDGRVIAEICRGYIERVEDDKKRGA